MQHSKIKNVKTLVETKFVGLYDVKYNNKNNDERHWMVASRKGEKELSEIYLENKEDKIDAVVICALHKDENKLVLIKQFRVPINNFIYELPAGLVDNNEDIKTAAARELKEETGLNLIEINKVNSKEKVYLSPGMTDESVAFIYCLCDGQISQEFLEDDEEIEALLISKEQAKEILRGDDTIDIKSYLMLQMFANLGEVMFK
ncbi:NUDIX hydrolase [Romboutsia sedimentorum]|uniref:NUDIX hydrolase n=1 Tax=Romboutsia sedimentorum TaxID=1368474 RepID=A0ABT7E9A8_9FIRM|nr:NUDIX hydrolase [Romboutsia sedimentorum]MDK2563503.1 NUDIX hydrolase [Romboutsia sedimentorum]MDK2585227.1 NUDIX hydrolase [Romboutsia sedimentorum]